MSAALLAGGKSTRMGRDKCRLEIDGTPLWRRQLDRLAPLAAELLVVAPTAPPWCPPEARWIEDLERDRGPLGGVAAALARATHERVIVLAVDLPALTSGYLETLLAESTATCGVVPVIGDLFQPLSAVYPRAAFPAAHAHLALADRSLQRLLRELIAAKMMRAVPVSASDRPLFRNLNSAADQP